MSNNNYKDSQGSIPNLIFPSHPPLKPYCLHLGKVSIIDFKKDSVSKNYVIQTYCENT